MSHRMQTLLAKSRPSPICTHCPSRSCIFQFLSIHSLALYQHRLRTYLQGYCREQDQKGIKMKTWLIEEERFSAELFGTQNAGAMANVAISN